MYSILVVDDNILDNTIIKDYLFSENYSIISAGNGEEALELIEGRSVDLIILDMVMPVMDGFCFLKLFSLTKYYGEVPIIVVSGMDDEESIRKVMAYNVFDYIIKPLNNTNKLIFINKIKNALIYKENVSELNKHKINI